MKLLIMQFPPASHYFPLRSAACSQTSSSFSSSLNVRALDILIFKVLERRWEDKRF